LPIPPRLSKQEKKQTETPDKDDERQTHDELPKREIAAELTPMCADQPPSPKAPKVPM